MKKLLLYAIAGVLSLCMILWPDMPVHSNVSGAPNGCTGSPFDFSGKTCGSNGGCHSGNPVTDQPGWISSNIPACGYTPGQTYSISVYVSSPGRTKFGFSLSPQNTSTGATAGTLIAGTGMQLTGGGRYITHQTASTPQDGTTNSKTWNFQWTAPASGVAVTFYASMNATNSSNTTAGDLIFTSSLSVISSTAPALSISNSGSNPFCSANPITLSSSIATGNAWTLNGNAVGNGSSISASESGTYLLTNTNGNCIQTQSITLSAVDAPPNVADISFGAQGNLICNGAATNLSTSSTDPVLWSPGNETTPSITVATPGWYAVSSTNACGTTTVGPVEVLDATSPNTPILVSSELEPICEGLPVTLSVSNVENGVNYVWNTAVSGATLTTTVAGVFEVEASNTCGTASSSFEVSFLPTPAMLSITQNAEGELQALGMADSYLWYLNGALIEGANTAVWIPTESGNYTVQGVSSQNSCASPLSEAFAVDISRLSDVASAWILAPQPAHGMVRLSAPELASLSELLVFDLAGRLRDRIALHGETSIIYTSQLETGLYILQAGNRSFRLVLE